MILLRWAGAVALALLSSLALPAAAQTASSIQAPAGYAPMQAPCVRQADGTCVPVSTTAPMPTGPVAITLADVSVTVSTAQAAGTAPLLPANPARRKLVITPAADCKIAIASGGTGTMTLIGGLSNEPLAPAPTNAIYLVPGALCAAAGVTLPILEG